MMLRARSIARASAVKIEPSIGRAFLKIVLFEKAEYAAYFFVESNFLTFEASQGNWYILLYCFTCAANSDFFWY